jgi:hypothetical protein
MKPTALPNELVRVISLLLEDLGSPVALSAYLLVREGDWDELAALSVNPRSYLDSASYYRDVAAISLVKKLRELPTTVDRVARATAKWWEGEQDCYRTNERLARYLDHQGFPAFDDLDPGVSDFLSEVRKTILSWIGSGPNTLQVGRFGPGATFSNKGRLTTVADKMSSAPSMTSGSLWYLPQWLGTQWGAACAARQEKIDVVPGNRFATVPKTSLIDRCIAAEPSINVFYQLALGRELRSRLRRVGWDLDYAQDVHRRVACVASKTREFATLDLSNASDTVCRNLVRILLPRRWYEALNDLRSPKTLIAGRWVMLEKFSSMGNGFTFELETILFAAICCVVSRRCGSGDKLGRDVFVFGDDIIIRQDAVSALLPVLRFCGFRLNNEKSFYDDSPFRESCGADFFAGKPVRPFYLKDLPNGPQDYFAFANGIHALTGQLRESGVDLGLRGWFAVLDQIPSEFRRCRGPKDLGDVVIHDELERWTVRWKDGMRFIRVLEPYGMKFVPWGHFSPDVVLACATYGSGDGRRGILPRDSVPGFKVGWYPFS